MPAKRRRARPKVGDRVRDKITRRVGTVDAVQDVDGRSEYSVAYDAEPQDEFLTTPSKDGAQRPETLLEPER